MDSWIIQLIVASFSGILVWYIRSGIESVRQERERLQENRRKIYLDMLNPFFKVFVGVDDPKVQEEAYKQIASLEYRNTIYELIFTGSDEVVLSLNDLLQYFYKMERENTTLDISKFVSLWGGFLLAIRRDLGSKGTKLSERDMLRAHLKDIDNIP